MDSNIKPDPDSPAINDESIQTYVKDMTKVLDSNKGGVIKQIIHEQERKEEEKQNMSGGINKNRLFAVGSFVFLLLAVLSLAYLAKIKDRAGVVPVSPQFQSIIFNDKTEFREIAGFSKDAIINTISNQAVNTQVKVGGLEGIYLTENKKVVGLRRFVSLIKSSFEPGAVVFVPDNFLIGVIHSAIVADKSATKDLFILLKARSFADIFPPMQAWEEKMLLDLYGLFGVGLNAETKYLLTSPFEDGILGNKNARILYDKEGQIVLMYVFADDNSVIITSSEVTAKEVMIRLGSDKTKN